MSKYFWLTLAIVKEFFVCYVRKFIAFFKYHILRFGFCRVSHIYVCVGGVFYLTTLA